LIRGAVGDNVQVHFKNNLRYPASIHAHGLFYNKDNEGAPYKDHTNGHSKADDCVEPGGEFKYKWKMKKRAGPMKKETSSILWLYHSHCDDVADTNAGLIGPIIVTKEHKAKGDDRIPDDISREFIILWKIFDENTSRYVNINIDKYIGDMDDADRKELKKEKSFMESNRKYAVNGFIYGNLPILDMVKGERVRWYNIAFGNEIDVHTPHWHGQTVVDNGNRVDVIDLSPAITKVVDMRPDDIGYWLLHCHVDDHINAGMSTVYRIKEDDDDNDPFEEEEEESDNAISYHEEDDDEWVDDELDFDDDAFKIPQMPALKFNFSGE